MGTVATALASRELHEQRQEEASPAKPTPHRATLDPEPESSFQATKMCPVQRCVGLRVKEQSELLRMPDPASSAGSTRALRLAATSPPRRNVRRRASKG